MTNLYDEMVKRGKMSPGWRVKHQNCWKTRYSENPAIGTVKYCVHGKVMVAERGTYTMRWKQLLPLWNPVKYRIAKELLEKESAEAGKDLVKR